MTIPKTTANTSAPNLDELPLEGAEDPSPKFRHFTDEDLPPLRLNASRVPERLSASTSSLQVPNNIMKHGARRRSLDLGKSRQRSRSPSLTKDDYSSGGSSMEDLDSDILTDRMGLEELQQQHSETSLHVSVSSLPPVNERLSEDTLEDVHAFSDVVKSSSASRGGSSRGGSIATSNNDVGSFQLETLDECDNEEWEHDHDDGAGVHISNLENLTIEEEEGDDLSVPTDAADASLPTTS